ncbi:MAG: AIPR family protein [Leptospira sp.]|nr:AIPR family protein [Leptospira sp.]
MSQSRFCMAITNEDERRLTLFFNQNKQQFGGKKDDYFALDYLIKKFEKPIAEMVHNVSFGNKDYGFDAFYCDPNRKNFYLYKFNWTENHDVFKESMDQIKNEGLGQIFESANHKDAKKNGFLNRIISELEENKNVIENIYLHFVFKGDVESAENSKGLQNRKEEIELKEHILKEYFQKSNLRFFIEYISDRRSASKPIQTKSFEIKLSDTIQHELRSQTEGDHKMYCGFVALTDIHKMYKALQFKFFDRNIRAGLSENNSPNQKIRESLKNICIKKTNPPEYFGFLHNGITLVAEKIELSEKTMMLYSPRLLNGAQTISSFDTFLEANQNHKSFDKNTLSKIKILAKIIESDIAADFVNHVTIANNQQNPVEPWHLRANDTIQCDIQDKFEKELQIFYSRQENSFSSIDVSELEELGLDTSRDIGIKDVAKVLLGVKAEVDNISKLKFVFESPTLYNQIFDPACLYWDFRVLVLGYKILKFLKPITTYLRDNSSEKHQYAIGKSSNLIFCLMIQMILNHKKLETYATEYGTSLKQEATFRDELKELALSKILPIYRTFLNDSDVKIKIDSGKLSFLNTKETFKRFMKLSHEKYGWTLKKEYKI